MDIRSNISDDKTDAWVNKMLEDEPRVISDEIELDDVKRDLSRRKNDREGVANPQRKDSNRRVVTQRS